MAETGINSENIHELALWRVFLKYFAFSILGLIGFYIIILIFFTLLIKEEDKSLKNIITKIKAFLSTVATQIMFLILSLTFGGLISVPLVYMAKNNAKFFANIFFILVILIILFFYIKRVISVYLKEKRISSAIASMFPAWFKILFWIVFTVYFLPLAIGMARTNLIMGILMFFGTVILINSLFYVDKIINYIKLKSRGNKVNHA